MREGHRSKMVECIAGRSLGRILLYQDNIKYRIKRNMICILGEGIFELEIHFSTLY